MLSWFNSLLDTTGFVPRKICGAWTDEWIAIHTLSDILIWLAYVSIPLVLLAVARHQKVKPFRPIIFLFAAFIVACGTSHLIEAIIFEVPVYKLSGVVKLITAIVSWATVFSLVPMGPRLVAMLEQMPDVAPNSEMRTDVRSRALVYSLAVLIALLAVFFRYLLDTVVGELHIFSFCLLAVTFVAWYGGFGPGLVVLLLSGTISMYLFIPHRNSILIINPEHQIGVAIYLFTGLGVVILGEQQRTTRRRLHRKMRQLSKTAEALETEKATSMESLVALDSFIHNAPYGIAYLNADLHYIRVNDTFANAHGMANNSGPQSTDLVAHFQSDLLLEFRKVLKTGIGISNRIVFVDAIVWELTVFPVPLAGSRPGLGIIGVDVTERHRAETRLRESGARFRLLTESMPQIVWMAQGDGCHEYYNARWYEFTGLSAEGTIGWGWTDQLHKEDVAAASEKWATAVAQGTVYDAEFRLRRADGEYHWFLARAVPARDENGLVVRWLGTFTHMDDQKRQAERLEVRVAERTAELRQQRIFLDAILDHVAEGIVACGADGQLKLFNAAARQMHLLPAQPVPSEQWSDTYNLYEADGITPMPVENVPLMRAWRGEDVREAELLIRAAGQADRYVLCSGQQLLAPDGSRFGAVVSMRDMTVRRAYERQLLETAVALRVSNEELETFAYIASHDLQEPLRKIQAFGTRLASRHRNNLDDEGKDYIDRMLNSAGRMRQLIEDLLSFSRVSTKKVAMRLVDLNEVAREVLSDLEERLLKTAGHVDVGALPTVLGDPGQLRQVFQNLISNALKFTRPSGSPVVKIWAVPFDQLPADADPPAPPLIGGSGWRIGVEDNGIGFEPDYGERIFELFQRLHARAAYEGTGLGLAIVRKILTRHGATVTARSRPAEGASFLIDWPTLPAGTS